MAWTKEQLDAIRIGKRNILVAAAAGSGKTSVLVERIVQKIAPDGESDKGVDVDKLLIVTFTRAAAAEMRERIYQSIQTRLEEGKGNVTRLMEQQALLSKSYIMTMHAFCQDVVRRFFLESGVDSSFRIAEESEMSLLQEEVLGDILEGWYAGGDPSFLRLAETYGGRHSDAGFAGLLLSLHRFIQSEPFPEQWLLIQKKRFDRRDLRDFGETVWGQEVLRDLRVRLQGMEEEFLQLQETAQQGGVQRYAVTLETDRQLVARLAGLCGEANWKAVWEAFHQLSFSTLQRITKEDDKELAGRIKASRDNLKKTLQKLAAGMFGGSAQAPFCDMERLYPDICCLVDLLLEFEQAFRQRKRQKHLLDYNDLEHLALQVLASADESGRLVPSSAAQSYRSQFEEVYVDEYQDTNLIQETILSLVSRCDTDTPNLFQVGDVKQSIYGFRQARPDLFLEKYKRYQSADPNNRLICLSTNFRSRKTIIGSVNYVFRRLMNETTCGMEYTKEDYLCYGASYYDEADRFWQGGKRDDCCELLLAAGLRGETGDKPLEYEAMMTARRIQSFLKDGYSVYEKETGMLRPVRYRDMVILLRALSGKASVFADVLRSAGIPVYCEERSGFFNSYEVSTMLSYLRILDNPLQDIPLLAVLRSPLFAFHEEELAEIRLFDRTCLFFEACLQRRDAFSDPLSEKLRRFTDQYEGFRSQAAFCRTAELIWSILQETGYYALAGLQPDGAMRQENLNLLFHRAAAFEQGNNRGIFKFVRYMERLRNRKMDLESASGFQEGMDAVRILSIHKSKGLEFPVVFLCGLGKPFNTQDAKQRMLRHRTMGFGPSCLDTERRLLYPSIMKESLKTRLDNELKAEEMRLLYVAMTRAREKLVLTGGIEGTMEEFWEGCRMKCRSADALPGDYRILSARSCLDWIGLSLAFFGRYPAECGTECDWRFAEWGKDMLSFPEENSGPAVTALLAIPHPAVREQKQEDPVWDPQVSAILDWQYPGANLSSPPAKLSVSEIKRMQEAIFEEEGERLFRHPVSLRELPDFLRKSEMDADPAERGSLLHACLQHVDLDRCRPILEDEEPAGRRERMEELTKELVSHLVANEFFTPRQGKAVEQELIVRFLLSPLFRRMLDAVRVWREIPFTILKPWGQIYPGDPDNKTEVAIQGMLDCYLEEPDGLVLIDFKSDGIREGEEANIAGRYRIQLQCYQEALRHITNRPVKETLLYFFRSGTVWRLEEKDVASLIG